MSPKPAGRKRVKQARPPARLPPARDRLLTWRGFLLVAVGGSGLASVATAYYARAGDALTAALFGVSLVLLLLVALVALGRVRRIRAEIARGP